MSVKAQQSVAVGNATAVQITSGAAQSDNVDGSSALLVLTGTATVFLGGPSVTAATGFPWTASLGPLSFDFEFGEALWGICASGQTSTVAVLETGI